MNLNFDELKALLKTKIPTDVSQWGIFEIKNNGGSSLLMQGTAQVGPVFAKWPDKNNAGLNKFVIQPVNERDRAKAAEVQALIIKTAANQVRSSAAHYSLSDILMFVY